MKKVIFIILTMFIAFAVTNCSEDVTGVATGPGGETTGQGGEADRGITLSISGTLNNSITVTADSNGNLAVDNGTAVFEYEASLTLAEIYTASITTNAITLTEPDGTDISTPYYVASFDTTVNTVTLTDTAPATTYKIDFADNILTVTDPNGTNTITGYITEFNNNTLTLTNPSTNYIVNVDNNNALTITESNNTVITNLYVTSFDATTNAVTLTNTEPNPVVYTPSVTGNTLTVTDPNGTNTITGYIDSLLNDIPGILTVKVGDVTITISDSDNDIIETGTTTLIISDLYEQYTLTKTPNSGTETVTVIDPDNGINYECGGETTYTPIITGEFLQNIEPNKSYCLKKDITLTESFEPIGYPDDNKVHSSLDDFNNLGGEEFTGKLDGEDNKITGLNINKNEANYIGLFAVIGDTGKVENLTIENPSVKGERSVGVLAGHNSGTIENVKINGAGKLIVDGAGQLWNDFAGGLVGSNNGTIENSHSTGTVAGRDKVGGLVGQNNSGGKINHSYATGNVEGKNNVSGLVGGNYGTITDSYATGNVEGEANVSGLVGWNASGGKIKHSYATGNVIGTTQAGGLVGENNGTIENSYFDITETKQTDGVSVGNKSGVAGYSTALGVVLNSVAIVQGDFINWDFPDTWQMNNGQWPVFAWQTLPPPPQTQAFIGSIMISVDTSGNLAVTKAYSNGANVANFNSYTANFDAGTNTLSIEEDGSEIMNISDNDIIETGTTTLLISNLYGQYTLTKTVSGTETLTTFDPEDNNTKYTCTDIGYTPIITGEFLRNIELDKSYCIGKNIALDGSKNFEPLGYPLTNVIYYNYNTDTTRFDNLNGKEFTGTLDGKRNTITGLNINKGGANYIGLFAIIGDTGKVENLTIKDPYVKGELAVGVLAGHNKGGINNVQINGAETNGEDNDIGGLVGYNANIITNSHSTGVVTGNNQVGGLVGNNSGTITSSSANMFIIAAAKVGGLVGYNSGTIGNSHSTGNMKGEYGVGGLVGGNGSGGSISSSYSEATANGTGNGIGGLVGNTYCGTIGDNYATGSVTGNDKAGSFVGTASTYSCQGIVIKNNYATGKVTRTGTGTSIGGFLGHFEDYNENATITIENNYFDAHTTDQSAGLGGSSPNAARLSPLAITITGYSSLSGGAVQNNDTTPADITQSDFDGSDPASTDDDWDFTAIWTMVDGRWPTLQWQTAP